MERSWQSHCRVEQNWVELTIRFEKTVSQEGIIVRQQTCATHLARTVFALNHCSCFLIILWLLIALS